MERKKCERKKRRGAGEGERVRRLRKRMVTSRINLSIMSTPSEERIPLAKTPEMIKQKQAGGAARAATRGRLAK